LSTCRSPLPSGTTGKLTIAFANNINARTLTPAIDMTAASFAIAGTGPNGATFAATSVILHLQY
jgi:hypothetical protein